MSNVTGGISNQSSSTHSFEVKKVEISSTSKVFASRIGLDSTPSSPPPTLSGKVTPFKEGESLVRTPDTVSSKSTEFSSVKEESLMNDSVPSAALGELIITEPQGLPNEIRDLFDEGRKKDYPTDKIEIHHFLEREEKTAQAFACRDSHVIDYVKNRAKKAIEGIENHAKFVEDILAAPQKLQGKIEGLESRRKEYWTSVEKELKQLETDLQTSPLSEDMHQKRDELLTLLDSKKEGRVVGIDAEIKRVKKEKKSALKRAQSHSDSLPSLETSKQSLKLYDKKLSQSASLALEVEYFEQLIEEGCSEKSEESFYADLRDQSPSFKKEFTERVQASSQFSPELKTQIIKKIENQSFVGQVISSAKKSLFVKKTSVSPLEVQKSPIPDLFRIVEDMLKGKSIDIRRKKPK